MSKLSDDVNDVFREDYGHFTSSKGCCVKSSVGAIRWRLACLLPVCNPEQDGKIKVRITPSPRSSLSTATQVPVSVHEYLRTSYSPDCDYIDGEVQGRNLGELDHAEVQTALAHWFRSHAKEWNIRAFTELRMQITPTRFRVADVCLISRNDPAEHVLQRPPIAVIEVLSPQDRISRYQQRFADYRQMGITHIRVVDPRTRCGYDCSSGSWIETPTFKIENSPISVDLSVIFAELE
jgi:Uma2 family endonuclease